MMKTLVLIIISMFLLTGCAETLAIGLKAYADGRYGKSRKPTNYYHQNQCTSRYYTYTYKTRIVTCYVDNACNVMCN